MPIFQESALKKCANKCSMSLIISGITHRSLWDILLVRKCIKIIPIAKLSLGTKESLNAICQEDLVRAYPHYFSPEGATLALVGNLEGVAIETEVTKHLVDGKRWRLRNQFSPS